MSTLEALFTYDYQGLSSHSESSVFTALFMFKSVYVLRDLLDNESVYREIFCES